MKKLAIVSVLLIVALAGCASLVRTKHALWGVSKVSPQELRALIDKKEVTVLDVRDVPDWEKSKVKIPTAIRHSPDEIESWIDTYDKSERLVVYCA